MLHTRFLARQHERSTDETGARALASLTCCRVLAVAAGGAVVTYVRCPGCIARDRSIRAANGWAIPGSRSTHKTQRIEHISSKTLNSRKHSAFAMRTPNSEGPSASSTMAIWRQGKCRSRGESERTVRRNPKVKYVDGQVHTNGMENYRALLKRGLAGTHVSVEPFHLFRYLDEQALRFNKSEGRERPRPI